MSQHILGSPKYGLLSSIHAVYQFEVIFFFKYLATQLTFQRLSGKPEEQSQRVHQIPNFHANRKRFCSTFFMATILRWFIRNNNNNMCIYVCAFVCTE